MPKHNWSSLGDVSALFRKSNDSFMREWAEGTLKLIEEIKYLNGCVVKGRGADIDAEHPCRNVFEYIKELELKLKGG